MKFKRKPNGLTLLFVGGPDGALPALGMAWAAGYDVLVADRDPRSPGIEWAVKMQLRPGQAATVGWFLADVYHAWRVLNAVRGQKVDGVLAVGTDVAPVVSEVAEALGLPHVPREVALLSWDKPSLKERLRAGGVPVPGSADFVVKPAYAGRGSRAVSIVSASADGFVLNHPRVVDASRYWTVRGGEAMFERYVPGPQISAEALFWKGELVFVGYTDRDYPPGRTVEAGGWGPSQHDQPPDGLMMDAMTLRAARAIGLETGTMKLDIVLDEERNRLPTVIELAVGRLSGGLMCSHYLPLVYSVDSMGAAFALVCGRDPRPFFAEHVRGRYSGLFLRGLYRNALTAASNVDRGRFFLALGRTREEAETKAEWKRRQWSKTT